MRHKAMLLTSAPAETQLQAALGTRLGLICAVALATETQMTITQSSKCKPDGNSDLGKLVVRQLTRIVDRTLQMPQQHRRPVLLLRLVRPLAGPFRP